MATILILDDNEAFRQVLAVALAHAGHEVREAADGRHVAGMLAAAPVDLLLTDLVMPDCDGIETISALRRSHPHLPVIAMSGDAPTHADLYLAIAGKLGAARMLKKPFGIPVLLAAVNEVLAAGPGPAGR